MAIGFRAAGGLATRASSNSTPLSVSVPSGTATNDLMLLVATSWSGNVGINTPSGWTLIATASSWGAGSGYRSALFYRVAGASESAVSLTTASASWLDAGTVGFSGVDTTTPLDVSGTWSATGSVNPIVVPSITTLTANAWWTVITVDGAFQISAASTPSGWTQRWYDGAGNIVAHVVNSVLVAAAGATSATTTPRTGGSAVGYVSIPVALREAVAASFVPQVVILT